MAPSPTCYRHLKYVLKHRIILFFPWDFCKASVILSFLSGVVSTTRIPVFSKFSMLQVIVSISQFLLCISTHMHIYIYMRYSVSDRLMCVTEGTESCFNSLKIFFHFIRTESYMRAWRTLEITGNKTKQIYSLLILTIVLHHVVLQQISHHAERLWK